MRELTARVARLRRGHGWAVGPTVTSVAASGTAAATTLVVARGIGAAEFGHFTVVLTIALIVTVGMLMSLHFVMYQELPRAAAADRPGLVTTALFATLVLSTGVVGAGLLAGPLLTRLLGVDLPTLGFGLLLGWAITVNHLTESFLRGLKRFRFVATLKLVLAVAYLAAASGCLLVLGIRDAEVYLVALIGMYVVFAALAATGFPVVARSWSATRARVLYRHGAYITAIAGMVAVLFGVDVLLLNHLADRTEVGVYSVYNGFPKRLLVMVLTEGVGVVLLPTMATADKPTLLRRIGRVGPAVGVAMAVLSFAASAVLFLLLRSEYPYSFGLMALSAVGIGAHAVFHLYFFALSMDGVRGARVFIGCLAGGLPAALACQAAFIAWWGVAGGLVAFALTNVLLLAIVLAATARVYRPARPDPAEQGPIRVGFVITQFPPNISAGLGRYAEEITPHLAAHPQVAEVAVFTLNNGRQPRYEAPGAGTVVHRPLGRILGVALRSRWLARSRRVSFALLAANILGSNLRYVWRLWRAGRHRQRPDLLVVHDSPNFLCGLLGHYLLRLPVVFHVHTTEHRVAPQRRILGMPSMLATAERWLGRIARRVVVATPEMRDRLAAAGWDRATIDVVCLGGTFERVLADPGFDRDRLRTDAAALRTRLGIGATDPVLLFVGRLVPHKGIYQLLAAMRQVAPAVPGLRLVVVGDGDETGVRRIAADSGLDGRVLTSGRFVDGAPLLAYYELADACVFPSTFEPFGLVATEAMAMGKPTILGDGFSRTFLGDPDRPAVRFVRSADPDDIAGTVIAVMTDPRLRAALGARGRQSVRERLSWTRAADESVAVYQAALAPRPGSVAAARGR